jgi:hypothetical protein
MAIRQRVLDDHHGRGQCRASCCLPEHYGAARQLGQCHITLRRSTTVHDACGIQSLALNITTFNCANVNGNTVILTVTDVNSNTSTCSANVTIEDNVAPIALCQNVTCAIGQHWQRFHHCIRCQQRQLRQLCDCNVGLEPNRIRLLLKSVPTRKS